MGQEMAVVATGATLHPKGNKVWESCTILGLTVLPCLHQFSNRSWAQAQVAADSATLLSLSLCVTGERSHCSTRKILLLIHHILLLLPVSAPAQTGLQNVNKHTVYDITRLVCQLSLVSCTHIYLGGTQQDRCDHTRVLLEDL